MGDGERRSWRDRVDGLLLTGRRLEVQLFVIREIALGFRLGLPLSQIRLGIGRFTLATGTSLIETFLLWQLMPLPLALALVVVRSWRGRKVARRILRQIEVEFEREPRLGDVLEHHRRLFDASTIAAIRVGEATSRLPEVVSALHDLLAARVALLGRIMSRLVYPVIVLGVAVTTLSVLLWKVAPTFHEMYASSGVARPAGVDLALTSARIGINAAAIALLLFAAFTAVSIRREKGLLLAMLTRAIPLYGPVIGSIHRGHLCRLLATATDGGRPLDVALGDARAALPDAWLRRCTGRAERLLAEGASVRQALARSRLLGPFQAWLIARAATAGRLGPTLIQLATDEYRRARQAREAILVYAAAGAVIGIGLIVGLIAYGIYGLQIGLIHVIQD